MPPPDAQQEIYSKFTTGNEVFDRIARITLGQSILVLDITRFESLHFINALFHFFSRKEKVLVVSCEPIDTPFEVRRIDPDRFRDPTELSIEIGKYRQTIGDGGILIHHYLPHILVKQGEDVVLRMIEYWLSKQTEQTINLFTLPKAAFPAFREKLQSLVSGVISIDVFGEGKGRGVSFQILGVCSPEFHMQDFPFLVEDGRLLIKWGDVYADILPREDEFEIRRRVEELKINSGLVRIYRGDADTEGLSTYDKWLLSQLIGWSIDDVENYFPERLDEVLRKLALWNLRRFVKFEMGQSRPDEEVRILLRDRLKLSSRIALSLPPTVFLSLLRRRHHTIPVKVYHALRRSVQAFISEKYSGDPLEKELTELETYFQDITARTAALESYRELGQDPKFKFDMKHLPKLVSIALFYGYAMRPKISKMSDGVYKIEVRDCFVCEGLRNQNPVCYLLIGTIVGCCNICFKSKFSCNEVECKAVGDKSCVFYLRKL